MSISQNPLREPTSYSSEGDKPYVPEMEIVNDFARFFAKKGESLSLDSAFDKYVSMHLGLMKAINLTYPKNEDELFEEIAKSEQVVLTSFEKITGLEIGQPIVFSEHSRFVATPKNHQYESQWKRVPDSWQLHGILGAPTTITEREPVEPGASRGKISLTPSVFIDDPFFITDSVEKLSVADKFIIKIHLSDSGTHVQEGVFFEPSMREDEPLADL